MMSFDYELLERQLLLGITDKQQAFNLLYGGEKGIKLGDPTGKVKDGDFKDQFYSNRPKVEFHELPVFVDTPADRFYSDMFSNGNKEQQEPEEPEEDHTGQVQNPITGEWKWL